MRVLMLSWEYPPKIVGGIARHVEENAWALADQGVDTVVLGCTHYPLLTGVISYVMGEEVTLVSSAEETAKDVYRVLADADLLRPDDLPAPTLAFSTTGDPEEFRGLARRFLGPEVETVFGNLAGVPVAVAP